MNEPRMFCAGCGADVTTSSAAGVYPCSKCGSTWRVGSCAKPVLTPSGPIFTFGIISTTATPRFGDATAASIGEHELEQR